MSEYGVILFHTSSEVFRSEKMFKESKIDIKLIPTPRDFSSDCGMAIRFAWSELLKIKNIVNIGGIDISAIHQIM